MGGYTYFERNIENMFSKSSNSLERMSNSFEKSVSLLEKRLNDNSKSSPLIYFSLNLCLISCSVAMFAYSWTVYKKQKKSDA